MEKKFWFVPKSYGWGLTPISWQGWLVTLVYVALLIAYMVYGYGLDLSEKNQYIPPRDVVRMVMDVILSAVAFIYVMENRTDGKVQWNWGKRK